MCMEIQEEVLEYDSLSVFNGKFNFNLAGMHFRVFLVIPK